MITHNWQTVHICANTQPFTLHISLEDCSLGSKWNVWARSRCRKRLIFTPVKEIELIYRAPCVSRKLSGEPAFLSVCVGTSLWCGQWRQWVKWFLCWSHRECEGQVLPPACSIFSLTHYLCSSFGGSSGSSGARRCGWEGSGQLTEGFRQQGEVLCAAGIGALSCWSVKQQDAITSQMV